MNNLRTSFTTLALTSSVLLSACLGDTVTSTGSGGGALNQPGTCVSGPLDDVWGRAQLSGGRTLPEKCPFVVEITQEIDFEAKLHMPKETTPFDGWADLDGIYSTFDGTPVVPSQTHRYYSDDPYVTSNRVVDFTAQYLAGHTVLPGNSPWSHDSGTVEARTFYGPARAFITLSAGVHQQGAHLDRIMISAPATGATQFIRAFTEFDTNAYNFSWRVNGQDIARNDAILPYNFGLPGDYDVTAFAEYLTGVDTIQTTLHVGIKTGVVGPGTIDPNVWASWSATEPVGYPPYTYQWWLDGGGPVNGSSYTGMFAASTQHSLVLQVTDSHGFSDISYFSFDVNSGTCPPDDPRCGETSKRPAHPRVIKPPAGK
jgi:hypothetical protein